MDEPARLRISVLGEVAAVHDGRPLDLGGRRQRAVLTLLLLARGEVVPAERIVDAVWGEHPPGNAHATLQSYVSHLRRALQPDEPARSRSAVIVREGPGYAFRQPLGVVDAWRFEALLRQADEASRPRQVASLLADALALWSGPALLDYTEEPWAEAEVARLTELRALARERLLAARLEVDEPALLVPELEVMVGEEPLREERWRLLTLALYRASRQADALGALRRARSILAEELGVDPGPALRELEAEVLAQSPALERPRRRDDPHPAPGAPTPRTEPRAPQQERLVERDRELVELVAALDDLEVGRPGVVLVEGAAGIGKSRLLAELRVRARDRSVRVLAARCSELESAFGYGVVRQLFEPELAPPGRRDGLLDGPAQAARSVFDPGDGGHGEGAGVLHGLYWLTHRLAADGPLVLTVDDAQWCDGASLRFLAHLVRRLAAVPVLVVAALRPGDGNPLQDGLLAELALEPDTVVLRPAALSEEATGTLVESRLGAAPAATFTHACHRTTSGNPLLLNQLLRTLAADAVPPDAAHADKVVAVGSRAISSVVQVRLRRLPEAEVEVARVAAVVGDGATLPMLADLAGLPEPRTAEALAALAASEVLRDEQPVTFVHPLIRDAVYGALPAAERGLRHERAAAALSRFGGSDEQVAAHLLLAPPRGDPDVVALLRTAARSAVRRGASDSAVTYLRRALEESPTGAWRPDVVLQLGLLEARLDGAAGARHLEEAYAVHTDPQVRAEIAIAAASTQVFASPPGVATAFAREAVAGLPATLVDQRQALVALQRISGFMHALEDGWRTPAPAPEGNGPGARMLAATVALQACLDGVDRDQAVRMARFALEDDLLLATDDGLFWVNAAAVRTLADDDIGTFWERARAVARTRGSLFATLSASLWEGFWRWRRGELHEALACLRDALDQDRMWGGARLGEPFARGFLIGCHLDRGDVAAARRVADALPSAAVVGEGGRIYQEALATLLVAEGEGQAALAALDAAPRGVASANPVWSPRRAITAAAFCVLGRGADALVLAEEEVALLRRWGAPSHLGRGLVALGELRARLRAGDGLDELVEAATLLSSTTAVVDLARARCALGSRPEVPDRQAVPLLEDARRTAAGRGARGVAEAATQALTRRGHPADLDQVVAAVGRQRDGGRPLSSTERRVLELAGDGLADHEVARRLFLTPDTVRAVLDALCPADVRPGSSVPQVVPVTMGAVQDRRDP